MRIRLFGLNTGTLVSDIILSAGGDRITDVDAGAVEGIAVFAVDNSNGNWQFLTNGGVWTSFGSVSQTTARLLASNGTTRIRFVPNASVVGTISPAISFRAWDQTSGVNGGTGNASINGGITAFSIATESASITISPAATIVINDVSVPEGDSGTTNAVFTISLTAPSTVAVNVNYATADGTATQPSDYQAVTTTTVTFNPGETAKTISITVNGDTTLEPDETFFVNLSGAVNAAIADSQGVGTILNDDPVGGRLVFSSATYTINEDAGSALITVNRTGNLAQAVTVHYATSDMTANERKDYTTTLGTLNFGAGESSKQFTVLVNTDSFAEGAELLALTLTNPTNGADLGIPANATLQINNVANPLPNTNDDPQLFVIQHYHDFLNREPDAPGLAFWTNQITSCGSDAACIDIRRINVSAAFFLSIEFQETGFTAFLSNRAAYGPTLPRYTGFVQDTQALQRGYIFTAPGSAAVLEANKVAYFADFVARPEFLAIYGALSNDQYVDTLIANTGVSFTTAERDQLVNGLNTATETRATVLRKITEKPSFKASQFNRAFVLMQYFGYLRRNPDDAPDNNLNGFNFWLNKLNQFNGNFVQADMVKAFLVSGEYRGRFGN